MNVPSCQANGKPDGASYEYTAKVESITQRELVRIWFGLLEQFRFDGHFAAVLQRLPVYFIAELILKSTFRVLLFGHFDW